MSSHDTSECWAMVCDGPGQALRREDCAVPSPGYGEVLVKVLACGVCRTDLHVVDGDIPAIYPIVPGHEIVGEVIETGSDVTGIARGMRIGVPWLGRTCGKCDYCRSGQENLCDDPIFTGATRDGGYATHAIADAQFCFPLPEGLSDCETAPLLCAGLIGWRAYRMAGEGKRLGLYGFGAAAHILAQVALADGRRVFAFTREGDTASQDFARDLGCEWAGSSSSNPGEELDAAIIFAPVGALVPAALKAVRKGGRIICAGIHMSEIPAFPYTDLWGERSIKSVANLTRADGTGFLTAEHTASIKMHTTQYALEDANRALSDLREGRLQGAAVLVP
ncbi:zinc-dependent alcohol dehydrogenase family protein [Altererythrobacter sp.]|uniref:zinc-dependent alcohol dehydrogenase family protein n=1 Tax=Altererythrobacter sp. TaxID=1872480 RepID=UPI003CFDEFC8